MINSSRKMSYSLDKDNMFRRLNNDTFKTSVKINHKEVKKTPVINYATNSNCDIMVTNFTLAQGETEPLKSGGPAKFTFQIANYTSVDSGGFNVYIKRDGEVGEGGSFYVSEVPAMTVINYPLEIHGIIGGYHDIEIEADYNDINRDNNKVTRRFFWKGIPNLQTVIINTVPDVTGICEDIDVIFRVYNYSYDNVDGKTNIDVKIDGNLGLRWEVTDFKARTYIEKSFTVNFKETRSYKITIEADSLTCNESNERDNIAEKVIKVKEAPLLVDNVTVYEDIEHGEVHWYYTQFTEDGKANFYLEPQISSLNVDLEVFREIPEGELIGKRTNGPGIPELIKEVSVEAGIKYYIKVSNTSGNGMYQIRCKNYTSNEATGIVSTGTKLYYGPSTSIYNSISSINSNQKVNILWKEDSWYYIEMSDKRGYVNNLSNISGMVYTKYHSLACNSTKKATEIYLGPGNNYIKAGTVDKAEVITLLNDELDGYKMIEYKVGAYKRKRGYIKNQELNNFNLVDYITFIKGEDIPNVLSSYYGGWKVEQGFNDHFSNRKGHLGYDLTPGYGMSDKIKPICSGNVVHVDKTNSIANGCIVVIEHKHKDLDIIYYSSYSHLKEGSVDNIYEEWLNNNKRLYVDCSKTIGVMGGTGGSTNFDPHLHLAIYKLNGAC